MKPINQPCDLRTPLGPVNAAFFWRSKPDTLLKVDIEVPKVDLDGNEIVGELISAQELKVGKMDGAISGSPAGLDIDKDVDRFYIRISGGALLQSASVTLSTENSDSNYDDDATEIELEVDGNDLVSDSLLLVSDDEDDDETGHDVGIDDSKNDRTHKVQLGGLVKIDNLIVGGQEFGISLSRDVKAKHTVFAAVRIVRAHELSLDSEGNEQISLIEPFSNQQIEAYLKTTNERFAQLGISVIFHDIAHIDPPDYEPGVFDLTDGLDTTFSGGNEELQFLEAKASASTSDLEIFIFNFFKPDGGKHYGTSYWLSTFDGESYKNAVTINGDYLNETEQFIPPHEIGHSLGLEHYPIEGRTDETIEEWNRNVMVPTLNPNYGGGVNSGRKRFIQPQEETALSSELVN